MGKGRGRGKRAAGVALGLWFAMTAVASANALVVVKVRAKGDAVQDGKVTLTSKGGEATFSCDTSGGTCKIDNVPGGKYTVTFSPKDGGKPSRPTPAMIAPEGVVTLFVAGG